MAVSCEIKKGVQIMNAKIAQIWNDAVDRLKKAEELFSAGKTELAKTEAKNAACSGQIAKTLLLRGREEAPALLCESDQQVRSGNDRQDAVHPGIGEHQVVEQCRSEEAVGSAQGSARHLQDIHGAFEREGAYVEHDAVPVPGIGTGCGDVARRVRGLRVQRLHAPQTGPCGGMERRSQEAGEAV